MYCRYSYNTVTNIQKQSQLNKKYKQLVYCVKCICTTQQHIAVSSVAVWKQYMLKSDGYYIIDCKDKGKEQRA